MPGQRPNILFLMSDQHSARYLRCTGSDLVDTPHLDELAAEGTVFTNAYCQNPLCVPSRSSLLTGQYSKSLGIYGNKNILEANSTTIPRHLSEAGYQTCLIGKAHFNGDQYHGFQQRPYGDLYGQAHQPDPERTPNSSGSGLGANVLDAAGPSGIPLPLTQTEICVAEASKWLQIHAALTPTQPFFLAVNFDKPHFPFTPPRSLFAKYDERVPPVTFDSQESEFVPFVEAQLGRKPFGPYFRRAPEAHRRALAAYLACVDWVDDAVGRILSVLDYLHLAENTIVIYTSDHGEMATNHGLWQKTVFFEDSVKVPLILRSPAHGSIGGVQTDLVGLIDLFPTICALTSTETPTECEGISLADLLGPQPGTLERDELFSESVVLGAPENAGCMMRRGSWKYCYYLDGYEELYDLAEDPCESRNLLNQSARTGSVDAEFLDSLRQRVQEFWVPEAHHQRYGSGPAMRREKHHYRYSNQFVLGDGVVVDGRP